ncbi:uncharacterized protein LOC131879276 [Tigriopus californicus]|uniref:uncharacterized protein LOC131879276 n=1 Tax=Tigriopus californicus TaxID=6832 RepID=UPI0027DA970E|nr:uncharacterized protein LOC131879276 [Tigriopus californicus]
MVSRSQVLCLTAFLAFSFVFAQADDKSLSRGSKALSIFNIIRFSNSACSGTGNRNGTCYTEEECTNKNGIKAGSCASGYGVCCIFSATCGQTTRENCTYFDSSTVSSGACSLEVCKCNDNICQLRLDFNSFVIAGPSTSTLSFGKILNGVVSATGKVAVSTATRCLIDQFSVTSPGNPSPPTICGINSGEHMYVDASDACNDLSFQLGSAGTTGRRWSIKVTQYGCDFENLAPDGCTQYFYGSNTGLLKTYNFDGEIHLANQEQKICVRQEAGNCKICYTTAADTDFSVSGQSDALMGFTKSSECCGYGNDGKGVNGYDCVVIPGALKQTAKEELIPGSQICGRKMVSADEGEDLKTICTDQRPFHITFRSDNYEEAVKEVNIKNLLNKGFRLVYSQTSCGV